MENNNKQNIQIAKIEKDVCYLRTEMTDIKKIVTNEIPHQINELGKNFQTYKESNSKWLIGILVSMVFLLITQFLK